MFLTAEELLAGKEMTFDLEIPPSILSPSLDGKSANGGTAKKVQLRPLTVRDVQLIAKAATDDEMREMIESPLVRAFFVLAKEFNWTPQQVKELTVGQILGYLEMLNQTKR